MQQPAANDADAIDATVLALVRGGELQRAFDLLVERQGAPVYRLCLAMLRDGAQAEDAAQETLIRVWRALPRFDGRAALSTWVYAIARNRCLTALSRRRDALSMSDPDVAEAAEAIGSGAVAGPDGADAAGLLREFVGALPERYRRCLTLYYYEDRSVADVAALLGVPVGTVKTNLHRAREALLAQIERAGLKDLSLWLERPT